MLGPVPGKHFWKKVRTQTFYILTLDIDVQCASMSTLHVTHIPTHPIMLLHINTIGYLVPLSSLYVNITYILT
jgi:hypothetical protein